MTQYLVTGDTGFLGSHTAEVLVQHADYQVHLLGNCPTGKSTNIVSGFSIALMELVTALNDALDLYLTPELQPACAGDKRRITIQLGFAMDKLFTDRLAEPTRTLTQMVVT